MGEDGQSGQVSREGDPQGGNRLFFLKKAIFTRENTSGSLSRAEFIACQFVSSFQYPPVVVPVEDLSHGFVVVLNKTEDSFTELFPRCEAGFPQGFPGEYPEPDFYLVEPGAVFRGVDKADSVIWSGQKFLSASD